MKPRLLVLLLLSASLFASALLRASPSSPAFALTPALGATVQTWSFDAASKELVVRMLNTSPKAITAFSMELTEHFADGTMNLNEYTTDYLPLMAAIEVSPGLREKNDDGTFPAGTSRDIRVPVAKELTDVSIVVDVVLYADHTAESSNKEMLGQLRSAREGSILAMQQANAVITKALSSPNPRDAASKELQILADIAHARRGRSDDPNSHTESTLRRVVSQVTQTDDLSSILKENETRIAFYSAHVRSQGVQP